MFRSLALATICLVPASLPAQFLTRPVNLAYLSRRAGVIVEGRVSSVSYEPMPGYEHLSTVRVTLEVSQMLRGPQTKQYTFRQWLPGRRLHASKYGAYQVGSELLLFLVSPSEAGLSSPIGAEQGLFHVQRDAQGHKYIANQYGNAGVFDGVVNDADQEGLRLSAVQRETTAQRGPIPLDRFIGLVRTLMTMPRIE